MFIMSKYVVIYPLDICPLDKLPLDKCPTIVSTGPDDYYAVIPYRDINKLFDLLNKHVRSAKIKMILHPSIFQLYLAILNFILSK